MKLAIVGSRDYPEPWVDVGRLVSAMPDDTIIISGGARGVDREAVAQAKGGRVHNDQAPLRCVELRPDVAPGCSRQEYAIAAYARNTRIVDEADKVVAFWDEKSKGTRDTIQKAVRAGKLVAVVLPEWPEEQWRQLLTELLP